VLTKLRRSFLPITQQAAGAEIFQRHDSSKSMKYLGDADYSPLPKTEVKSPSKEMSNALKDEYYPAPSERRAHRILSIDVVFIPLKT
jgi:hypothetical protein